MNTGLTVRPETWLLTDDAALHSRMVQRIRRRYAAQMHLLADGAPLRAGMQTAFTALQATAGRDVWVPALWLLEMGNLLLSAHRRKRITGEKRHELAIAAGALASIRHLKTSQIERARHQERVSTLKARLAGLRLPVMDNPSHIVPISVGDPVHCKAVTDTLLTGQDGIAAHPFRACLGR